MAIVINGSGTVTGLAVGGLPDGTVDAGTLATNSVDSAELIDGAVDRSHLATSIADSGNATAMTISASENLRVSDSNSNSDKARISTFQSNAQAGTSIGGTNLAMAMQHYGGANSVVQMGMGYCVNHPPAVIGYKVETNSGNTKGDIFFATRDTTNDVAPTERMRITVSGNVGIGETTPAYTLEIGNVSSKGWSVNLENNSAKMRSRASANDTQTHWDIMNGNGVVGTIKTVNSSTQFNTSSDYRLKENVDYTWDATTRLKQLKPARFNFIADNTNTLVDGFIAHEVSSVVPEAISGAKDAMTEEVLYVEGDKLPEGKSIGDVKEASVIEPQGIDQSKLVPLLVKTIQELEARITALEA